MLTAVLYHTELRERGETERRKESKRKGDRKIWTDTMGNRSLPGLQACHRNSGEVSFWPTFTDRAADTARLMQRNKDNVLPKFPQRKVWEQCAFFEQKPFASSPAKSWPCFQNVLSCAASASALTIASG